MASSSLDQENESSERHGEGASSSSDQDIERCEFECQKIRGQLIKFYNRAKDTMNEKKSTDWNRFVRRFQLALVWDTLMCDTDQPIIFNPKTSRGVTDKTLSTYRVYWDGNDIKAKSTNDYSEHQKLQPGPFIVEVIYVKRSKEEVRRRCEFTIDANTEIGDGKLGEDVNKLCFEKKVKFNKPKLICAESIVQVLEQMALDEGNESSDIAGEMASSTLEQGAASPIKTDESESEGEKQMKNESLDLYGDGAPICSDQELETLFKKFYEIKKRRATEMRSVDLKTPDTGDAEKCKKRLEELTEKVTVEIDGIEKKGYCSGLKSLFEKCARLHFVYCDIKDVLQKTEWKNFLTEVCRLYDILLAWVEMHYWPNREDTQEKMECLDLHRSSLNESCRICPESQEPLVRNEKKYCLHRVPHFEMKFCQTKNVIYARYRNKDCKSSLYVGKTINHLLSRYNEDSLNSLNENGSGETFHILQIVNEADLFNDNTSFKDFVKTFAVDLRGVEILWINHLKPDRNTQMNFNYTDSHRDHMSLLLRHFIARHEIEYVLVDKVNDQARPNPTKVS